MFRGQRFEVDLDGDGDGDEGQQRVGVLPGTFVGDVLERKPAAVVAPSAPVITTKTGFPEHRKRSGESRFKQRQSKNDSQAAFEPTASEDRDTISGGRNSPAGGDGSGNGKTWEQKEKEQIDGENQQKLAQMSPGDIEEERRALLESLSPAMIQRLLQRSNIDSGSAEADLSTPRPPVPKSTRDANIEKKSVSFAELNSTENGEPLPPNLPEPDEPTDSMEELSTETPLPHDSVHFPRPNQPPDLDPSSETFLQDLHEKYFPSLPSDPDKLEWMQTSTTSKSSYDPSAAGLEPKEIRFSFKGELIPPRIAAQIPVTAGLHHHGDAPDAAGYTISELVHLGHSSFAPQRCIAFQTLGRLLFRLGKGEFGDSGEPGAGTEGSEDTFGALARGIWRVVEEEKVVAMLVMESEGKGIDRGKHVSAKAYATEAVWLWQRGGGRSWKAE